MLLHSILDTIFEPKEQPLQIPQDDSWFDPLCILLEIKKWGILQRTKWANGKNQIKNYIYCQEKSKVKPPLNKKKVH